MPVDGLERPHVPLDAGRTRLDLTRRAIAGCSRTVSPSGKMNASSLPLL
jgi:hypothetical protein